MSNGYATEDLEAILESLESDESDESDEFAEAPMRQSSRFRPPTTASGRGLAPSRPQPGFVTEARLQEALAQVGRQIKTNSDAIKAVNSRLNTISGDIARQTAALKKEAEERKKDNAELRNAVQLSALLPLLVRPPSRTVNENVPNTDIKKDDKVLIESSNTLTTLLPLLLLGGLGGSSSPAGTSTGGGLSDPTTLLLVVLATSGGLSGGK